MRSTNIGIEAADDIAFVLSNNASLEHLYLDDASLQNKGVIRITNSLQNISSLKTLQRQGNN